MNKALRTAIPWALLILLAMWATSQVVGSMSERTYQKHERRVLEFAQRKEHEADSLKAVADSLARQRDSLAASVPNQVVRTVYVEAKKKLLDPPDATTREMQLIAGYTEVIDTMDGWLTRTQVALQKSQEAEAALRGALARSDERGDSLQAFILRPKKKPSRLALAAFGGQCVGQNGVGPCIGVGLSWRIF